MITEQEAVSIANRAVARRGTLCQYGGITYIAKDHPFAWNLERDLWLVSYRIDLDGHRIDPSGFGVEVDAITGKVRVIESL